LTRERTVTRKLKEIVLALQLNDYLENKIKQQYPNLTPEQVKQKVKEKILEMYLNYIFL
jgi:membrane peptidoglycan carboxypeptidase